MGLGSGGAGRIDERASRGRGCYGAPSPPLLVMVLRAVAALASYAMDSIASRPFRSPVISSLSKDQEQNSRHGRHVMNFVTSPLPRSSGTGFLSKIRARCAKPHLLRPCGGTDFSGPKLDGFG